jgi:hypothetical protein
VLSKNNDLKVDFTVHEAAAVAVAKIKMWH